MDVDLNGGGSMEIPEGELEIDAKGKVKAKKPKFKMPSFKKGKQKLMLTVCC